MPRFFISTAGYEADDDGVELVSPKALEAYLCRTLTGILHDENKRVGLTDIQAEARDEDGRTIMRAKVSFVVDNLTDTR